MNAAIALLVAANAVHGWHGGAPRHFPHAHRHFISGTVDGGTTKPPHGEMGGAGRSPC